MSSYFTPCAHDAYRNWEDYLPSAAARQAMQARTKNRRLIVTESGLLGLAPLLTQPGDAIMIIIGHSRPVVARRRRDITQAVAWRLIGEVFVDGMMESEMMERHCFSGEKEVEPIYFV